MMKRFIKEECGVSATEYAILIAVIILGSMVAIMAVGTKMVNGMSYISENIG